MRTGLTFIAIIREMIQQSDLPEDPGKNLILHGSSYYIIRLYDYRILYNAYRANHVAHVRELNKVPRRRAFETICA